MRRALAILLLAAVARADELGTDVVCTIVDSVGKPAPAEVYLVRYLLPTNTYARATADAGGRATFAKDLFGRLWKERIYPQIIAVDAAGRFGAVRFAHPGFDEPPYRIRLLDSREVSGRVVGTDGKPVGGVTVTPTGFEMQVDGVDFADALRLPAEVRERYRTTADSAGRFTLRGVPTARVLAEVSAPGFATIAFNWDPKRATDLTLPRGVVVTGRLVGVDAAGRTLALDGEQPRWEPKPKDAVVAASAWIAVTAADGTFRFPGIPAGKHTFTEEGKPNGTTYFDARTFESDGSRDVTLGAWPLKPMRKLRGRVLDEAGRGVPDVRVSLVRFRDPQGPFGRGAEAIDSETVTDHEGGYSGYVRPHHLVGAQIPVYELPDGYAQAGSSDVVAADPPAEELPPIRLGKSPTVLVRVVDGGGRPVAGARVQSKGPNYFSGLALARKRVTGADGTVKLHFLKTDEPASLYAEAAEAVSLVQSVHPSEAGPVTLRVSPEHAFRIAGRVADVAGRPLADVTVVVSRMVMVRDKSNPGVAGTGGDYARLRTDSDGRFVGGPYVAGDRFHVRVRLPGARPAQSAEVVAEVGKTHDFGTLTVVRFDGVVRGRVVDTQGKPVVGAKVINGGDGQRRIVTATGSDGGFEISDLISGPVQVVAFADGFRPGMTRADASKPDTTVVTLRRAGEPDGATPDGVDEAAVKRAARVVFDRVWEWTDGRTPEIDKLLLEYLARIDSDEATRRCGKPPEPKLDDLADDDPDAALAQLAKLDANTARRDYRRLAERYAESDRPKALRFATEMLARARATDATHRPFGLTDAGALLAKLGRRDAGRKLVEDVAADAERLPASDWNGFVRAYVAARLAPFDLPRALRLLEAEKSVPDRDRYLGMMAKNLVVTDVAAASERLEAVSDDFRRSVLAATCAHRLAGKDSDAAVRLAEMHGKGSNFGVLGIGWSALAAKDRATAHRIVERAFRRIHDRGDKDTGYAFAGTGWGETAAHIAIIARHLDYPDRAALAAHVLAERPTTGDVFNQDSVTAGFVVQALALADIDRTAARSLLEVAEANRQQIVGNVSGRVGDYLGAWALIDPARAVGLLTDALAARKARGGKLETHDATLSALNLMTAAPGERQRLIAIRLGSRWPTDDIE